MKNEPHANARNWWDALAIYDSLFEHHPDALALHDVDGRFLRVNPACELLTGYSAGELVGQTTAILEPSSTDKPALIRAALERGQTVEFEITIVTKQGTTREVEGRRVPLHVDGVVRGYCGMTRDVTEQRQHARSSQRQAARIAELYGIAAAGGVGSNEKIATALEAGRVELGAESAFLATLDQGPPAIALVRGKALAPVDPTILRRALAAGDAFVIDDAAATPRAFAGASLSIKDRLLGAIAFVYAGAAPRLAPTDHDYMRALAALIASAVAQGEREKRLDTLAFGDALTGLPNRALLQDRLEQTLLSARRRRRSFAAHYIDIDHFKSINDTYGHQAGDAVLIAVSSWLRDVLRDSDTIGRIGGDEFVVLQPEIDSPRQAEELAAKLCGIRDHTFHVGGNDLVITISVGCAVFPADADDPVDILRAADSALYDVKHRGRDGYAIGLVGV